MPELPEVETIVRFLRPKISGRKILSVEILADRVVRDHRNKNEIEEKTVGKKITDVRRAGKYVVLHLSGGKCFLFHLMMTGKLLLNSKENKHDRFRMFLSGGVKLIFNDIRKFGKCQVVSEEIGHCEERSDAAISNPKIATLPLVARNDNPDTVQNNPLNKLGTDPLKISFSDFQKQFLGKSKNIKNFLLDQKNISGIGNIYADEILWDAGIYPLRKIETLKSSEIFKLYESIQKVLRLAVKKGGTSSRNYRKPDDTEGEYYKFRKVYQRTGEKCSRCGGFIQRIMVGGRSTHFCPKHQV